MEDHSGGGAGGEGKGHRTGKEVLGGGPGSSLTWVDVGQLSELANPGGNGRSK